MVIDVVDWESEIALDTGVAYHPWWLGRVPLYAGRDWPVEFLDWTD